ncbi:unnamed protein product [Closterium sp. NIES-64]|nr:unnamed protein product [Closterium sp. NIES-64]
MRDKVRKLVASGRLEFINGGWVMHDEACAHYTDMVHQMAMGHRFLMATFNVTPRIAWQIDPFGHSATQASLITAQVRPGQVVLPLLHFPSPPPPPHLVPPHPSPHACPPGAVFMGRVDQQAKDAHMAACEFQPLPPFPFPIPSSPRNQPPPLSSHLPLSPTLLPQASLHQTGLQAAGLEAVFMGRVDQQEKESRLAAKTMEFVWRADGATQRENQVLGMVSYDGYYSPSQFRYQDSDDPSYRIQTSHHAFTMPSTMPSTMPVSTMPCTTQSSPHPLLFHCSICSTIVPLPSSTGQDNPYGGSPNVQRLVDEFVAEVTKRAEGFKTNHLLFPMGEDFAFDRAILWFKNMDKLIHYVNLDGRVNALYSTPSMYLDALHSANATWPLKTGDMFPLSPQPWGGRLSTPHRAAQHTPLGGTAHPAGRHSTAQHTPLGGIAHPAGRHSTPHWAAQHAPLGGTARSTGRHSTLHWTAHHAHWTGWAMAQGNLFSA